MFLMLTALEDVQLECLFTSATAAEMWTKLVATYERASATNKLQLMQKFHEWIRLQRYHSIFLASKIWYVKLDVGESILDVVIESPVSLPCDRVPRSSRKSAILFLVYHSLEKCRSDTSKSQLLSRATINKGIQGHLK